MLGNIYLNQSLFKFLFKVQYAVFEVKNNALLYTAKLTVTYTLNGIPKMLNELCIPSGTQSINVPPGAMNIKISANAIFGEHIFSDMIASPQWKCYEVGGGFFTTNWKVVSC
jgi:hypothetical protein